MTVVVLVAGIWSVLIIVMLAMLLALLRSGRRADWPALDIPSPRPASDGTSRQNV